MDNNNPFQSFNNPPIVSQPVQSQPKKGPVIALILVVLVIVAGLIAWLIIDNTPQSSTSEFNTFLNYTMFAENNPDVSTENIEKFKNGELTSVKVWDYYDLESGDEKTNYFSQQNQNWQNFYQKYQDSAQNTSSETSSLISELNNYQIFLITLVKNPPLSNNDIFDQYLKTSSAQVSELINTTYDSYFNSGSELAKTFAEAQKNSNLAQVSIMDIYAKSGCIKNGQIVEGCSSNISNDDMEQILSYINTTSDKDDAALEVLEDLQANFIQKCVNLYDKINGVNSNA